MMVRIGHLIRERREIMGLSRDAFIRVAGVGSRATVQNAEAGAFEISPINQKKFEKGLNWAPGAIRRAMDKAGEMDPAELTMKDMDGGSDRPTHSPLHDFTVDELLAEVSRRYRVEQAPSTSSSNPPTTPTDAEPEQFDHDLAASDDMTRREDGE